MHRARLTPSGSPVGSGAAGSWPSRSVAGGIVIGAAAGLLMGAVVAAVTGWFLIRILEHA